MITGAVTPGREAIVQVRLRGPQGALTAIDAVLDTGFTEYLSLPQVWVTALALPYLFTDDAVLADGSQITVDVYEGVIDWDGHGRVVPVHCMEGTPLMGMSLLWDHLVNMLVVDGGIMTIDPVP